MMGLWKRCQSVWRHNTPGCTKYTRRDLTVTASEGSTRCVGHVEDILKLTRVWEVVKYGFGRYTNRSDIRKNIGKLWTPFVLYNFTFLSYSIVCHMWFPLCPCIWGSQYDISKRCLDFYVNMCNPTIHLCCKAVSPICYKSISNRTAIVYSM